MIDTRFQFNSQWWEMVKTWPLLMKIYYVLGFTVFWCVVLYATVKLITY